MRAVESTEYSVKHTDLTTVKPTEYSVKLAILSLHANSCRGWSGYFRDV